MVMMWLVKFLLIDGTSNRILHT